MTSFLLTGWLAFNNGRAFAEFKRAIQLAPASGAILVDQAWIRYSAGDRQAKAAVS